MLIGLVVDVFDMIQTIIHAPGQLSQISEMITRLYRIRGHGHRFSRREVKERDLDDGTGAEQDERNTVQVRRHISPYTKED